MHHCFKPHEIKPQENYSGRGNDPDKDKCPGWGGKARPKAYGEDLPIGQGGEKIIKIVTTEFPSWMICQIGKEKEEREGRTRESERRTTTQSQQHGYLS